MTAIQDMVEQRLMPVFMNAICLPTEFVLVIPKFCYTDNVFVLIFEGFLR